MKKFDNQRNPDAASCDSETFIRTKPEEKSVGGVEGKRMKDRIGYRRMEPRKVKTERH
jgi:hypothetical protein